VFTCFSKHVLGWLDDKGTNSAFLIALMNPAQLSIFQIFVILLETLNEGFCEFSSTLGG
jgi:hypothetical protein